MTGLGAFNSLAPVHLSAVITCLHNGRGHGLLRSLAFIHRGAVERVPIVAGPLWTAVEPPVTSQRLAAWRHRFPIGYGTLVAVGPVLAVGFAVGLFQVDSPLVCWLAVAALIGFSCMSAIALIRSWGQFAHNMFYRKDVLVAGNSCDRPQTDVRLGPAHAPQFRIAGVPRPGDCAILGTKNLRRRRIRDVAVPDEAIVADLELRTRGRPDKMPSLGEAERRELPQRLVDIDRVQPNTLAANSNMESSLAATLARRSADIVFSTLLLICTLPLATLTAAFIKLDGPGPVFSWQERVGLQGRLFQMLTFRSTRVNVNVGRDTGEANAGTSEVTRVGRLLRRTRINELPQLWNVLRGDMSVIGPRPECPLLVARFAADLPCYNDRTLTKPGIIGWAQVNSRYRAWVEDAPAQLAYDLYYLKHRNVLLDLRILAITIRSVMSEKSWR